MTIAVTSHGRATGYFVSALAFEEFQRLRVAARRSPLVADLTEARIAQIAAGRMDAEFEHPNALLHEE